MPVCRRRIFRPGWSARSLADQVLALVNAGHAAPYPLRQDQMEVLKLPPDLPFGLFQRSTYRGTHMHQEPRTDWS